VIKLILGSNPMPLQFVFRILGPTYRTVGNFPVVQIFSGMPVSLM